MTIEMTRKAIELMDKYTTLEERDAGFFARLKIGVQSFDICQLQDEKNEAEWYRCMMGKALSSLIRSETMLKKK